MENAAELAWAGGLFEGEGSIGSYYQPKRNGHGGIRNFMATVTSTDRDVVDRFERAVGFGKVYGPYGPHNGHKPFYAWRIQSIQGVLTLFHALGPWMGDRRRAKFQEVLDLMFEGFYQRPLGNRRLKGVF